MSDELLNTIIANTFDVGIMIGETGAKNHPDYKHKKEEFRDEIKHTMLKEIRTTIKYEGVANVLRSRRVKELV